MNGDLAFLTIDGGLDTVPIPPLRIPPPPMLIPASNGVMGLLPAPSNPNPPIPDEFKGMTAGVTAAEEAAVTVAVAVAAAVPPAVVVVAVPVLFSACKAASAASFSPGGLKFVNFPS